MDFFISHVLPVFSKKQPCLKQESAEKSQSKIVLCRMTASAKSSTSISPAVGDEVIGSRPDTIPSSPAS